MFQRRFLTGLAVTLLVVQACGSDDGKKRVTSSDAGVGGEAGTGDEPSSGGSSAGQPQGGEPNEPGGTGGMAAAGEPNVGGGGTGPLPADPELLFTVNADANGLADTGVFGQAQPQNAIYTSSTGAQDEVDGDNTVKVVGADLGLAEADSIVSFTLLQPKPQNPQYLFSVVDGGEGAPPTRVFESTYWDGNEEGDVYFSDGVPSYRELGEGGDQLGYNGLLMSERSLGVAPRQGDEPPDELRGLMVRDANVPLTELYFATNADAVGLTGSAVEATSADERGCTLFQSALDGTNTVAFTCAQLGLAPGDQLDALLLYGSDTPSELVFSVTPASVGATGTAVEADTTVHKGAALFQSTGEDGNTLFLTANDLGLGEGCCDSDDIDGLAVVDAPPGTVEHAATCDITYDPFALTGGGELSYFGGASRIGSNVLVMFGGGPNGPRLIAYNAATCAFIDQKDMPAAFDYAPGWAIVPLAGWSAATPFAAVEFLRTDDEATKILRRFDAAGVFVEEFPISTLTTSDSTAALIHEPLGDQLYLVTNYNTYPYQFRLSVMPRPASGVIELTPEPHALTLPCTYGANINGTDALGNLIMAQYQRTTEEYRVCRYSPQGELLPSPYWWTPETAIEPHGLITANGTHLQLSTNEGMGPSTIERGTYVAP